MKKYTLFFVLLALLLAWHLSRPDDAPAPDPDNYVYPTPKQLDSLWQVEVGRRYKK